MAPTKPTKLANLLSKIHPPLSMSPRESQQLVKTISKSFEEHLDKEHPRTPGGSAGHSDAHISSILSNPHFNGTGRLDRAHILGPRSASTGSRAGTIEQLQTFLLNGTPLRALHKFRQEVASGEATLESAKQCLKAHTKNPYEAAIHGNASSTRQDTTEVLPGRVVANWLWSSGLEESMEFVYDMDLLESLVNRLCTEGQSKRAIGWLHRLGKMAVRDSSVDLELINAGQLIFRVLLERKESAFEESLKLFSSISQKLVSTHAGRQMCRTAARRLSHLLSSDSNSDGISRHLYDDFALNLPKYLHGTVLKHRLAWLDLKHPENPNPDLALAFLRRVDLRHQATSRQNRNAMIRSHHEVASVLRSKGRHGEAEEMIRILDTKLAIHKLKEVNEPVKEHSQNGSRRRSYNTLSYNMSLG